MPELSTLGYDVDGNNIIISGITPPTGDGGNIDLRGGDGGSNIEGTTGGTASITGGSTALGNGGAAYVTGGNSTDGGAGGTVIIAGGVADGGNGGSIQIQAGSGGDGIGGEVFIAGGGGSSADGKVRIAGIIKLQGLATADPLVAGQIYSDGAPSAGVPKALMISGGPA